MPARKKNFTAADGDAVSKLFFKNEPAEAGDMPDTAVWEGAAKRGRGKRSERFGLLLDEQLKEDLGLLFKATNSRSVNDLVINILSDFVAREDNQARLRQYRELIGQ